MRPSCQHQLRPRHAPATQHLVHVRLTVRTTNHIDEILQHCSIQSMYDSLYGLLTISTICFCSAASSPRMTRCTDYRPHRWHDPVLQYLVHVRLAVPTSNYIDLPQVNPMYFKNRDFDLPTSTIPATDITHLADSLPTTTHLNQRRPILTIHIDLYQRQLYQPSTSLIQLMTQQHKHIPTTTYIWQINCHICYAVISSLFPSLFFWLSLLARLTVNSLRGRRAYRLRNKDMTYPMLK